VALDVGPELVRGLRDAAPDAAFIALHGPGGEDGTPQELLDLLGIPYTGSGVAASLRCVDKVRAKHELRAGGVSTPDWVALTATALRELGAADTLDDVEARLGSPLVVKPAAQGSALGVRFAAARADIPEALLAALNYDDRVLVERYVSGRELAVSLLDGEPLPVVEVVPREEDRFNYEARYEIGRTDYVCPATLEPAAEAAVLDAATRTWSVLGMRGFGRVDMILSADGPEVLEADTVPGVTDTSLLPLAAEAAGIGFDELCDRIVALALTGDPPLGSAVA
jgi:D-alanine-D-alanine ligase